VWLPAGEKKFKDCVNRFDSMPACEDEQTEGHLVTTLSALCIASCGKNETGMLIWILHCMV